MNQLSKYKGIYDFRQGTTGRFEVVFLNYLGEVVEQDPLPTIEVLYVNQDGYVATAVGITPMDELEQGRYYYDWHIPLTQRTIEHQVHYVGAIDQMQVVGEDTVTVLPRDSDLCCTYTPTIIQGAY